MAPKFSDLIQIGGGWVIPLRFSVYPVASSTTVFPFSTSSISTFSISFSRESRCIPCVDQKGTNAGGLFAHKADRSLRWYVKKLPTADHAKNEVCGLEGRHTDIFIFSRICAFVEVSSGYVYLHAFYSCFTPLEIIERDNLAKNDPQMHFSGVRHGFLPASRPAGA